MQSNLKPAHFEYSQSHSPQLKYYHESYKPSCGHKNTNSKKIHTSVTPKFELNSHE